MLLTERIPRALVFPCWLFLSKRGLPPEAFPNMLLPVFKKSQPFLLNITTSRAEALGRGGIEYPYGKRDRGGRVATKRNMGKGRHLISHKYQEHGYVTEELNRPTEIGQRLQSRGTIAEVRKGA